MARALDGRKTRDRNRGGIGAEGIAALKQFVEDGGTLITLGSAALAPVEDFPPEILNGERRTFALLFKDLATLRTDAKLFADVEELRWRSPTDAFAAWAERIGDARLLPRSNSVQRP